MLLETLRTSRVLHGLQIVGMGTGELCPSGIQIVRIRGGNIPSIMRLGIWVFFIGIAIVEVSHTDNFNQADAHPLGGP